MSSARSIALSGLIAAIIAIGLVAAVILTPGVGLTGQIRSSSSPNESTSTINAQSENGQGDMAVLFTDPPTVPANVSSVYINYNDVQAHIANAGNETGWYDLTGSGEINLMSVVNVSETIANQSLPQGRFNGLRFNITSIVITYEGRNETGLMINGRNTSYVWIPGGITVNALETTSAMIDYTPTVLLAGNSTNPTFLFVPDAVGYVVPTSSIPAESHIIGTRIVLNNNPWWQATERSVKFGITSVVLTPDSLRMTVVNQGASAIYLRFATVTAQSSLAGGVEGTLATSAVFVIGSTGSLSTLATTNSHMVEDQESSAGYLLSPGQSITLHYSGAPIEIGAQIGLHMQLDTNSPIIIGSYYHVLVQANGQIAQAAVQATAS